MYIFYLFEFHVGRRQINLPDVRPYDGMHIIYPFVCVT